MAMAVPLVAVIEVSMEPLVLPSVCLAMQGPLEPKAMDHFVRISFTPQYDTVDGLS